MFVNDNDAQMAGLASAMLRNVDDARQAIARQDHQSAAGSLDVALGLVSQIYGRAGAHSKPLIVTIRSEMETESVLVPARRSGAPRRDTTVSQVSGRYSAETIDIDEAREHMASAKAALMRRDFSGADAHLDSLQKSVKHETVTGEMPLLRVRDNLSLALARVHEGKFKHAAPALHAAVRALANYTGSHSADAARLRTEIESYARDIEDSHADAADRINAWSSQVSRWLEQTPGR
jgi:hypothetical protein